MLSTLKLAPYTAMWLFSLHTVECKKGDVCDCYYTVVTSNYDHIVIVITYQLLVHMVLLQGNFASARKL